MKKSFFFKCLQKSSKSLEKLKSTQKVHQRSKKVPNKSQTSPKNTQKVRKSHSLQKVPKKCNI